MHSGGSFRRITTAALIAAAATAGPAAAATTQSPAAVVRNESNGLLEELVDRIGAPTTTNLLETSLKIEDNGMAHRWVQQYYKWVPVFGGEAIIHLKPNGDVFATTDSLVRNVSVASVKPQLNSKQAIAAAVQASGSTGKMTAPPQVQIFILPRAGADQLVYRVRIERLNGDAETLIPTVFVDANTGKPVMYYDDLQTAGTATTWYSGTVSLNTLFYGNTYYLEDLTRKLGTFDYRNSTSSYVRSTDADNVWDTTTQKAMGDAQYNASAFYDYLKNVQGRNGIDGSGGPGYITSADGSTPLISSMVHYATKYNNAFWNGQTITYGDGDGTTFTPLVTLDITGHEMFHGVTSSTANLTYSGESGALNESWSDVFGAMLERYVQGESADTWKIGEDAYTPSTAGDALRYMDNPHGAANSGFTSDDDPDHYSERYTGTSDNGGVHINSGIANKAFYLLAKGGTHHLGGSMTGIGADTAAKIWFKALTTYMTSSTNFAGARTATINAATAIYGSSSPNVAAVQQAWCLVGVGACSNAPPPPPANATELITNGGFEGSISPWVETGSGALYTNAGNYPHGGTGYAYIGSANSTSGTISQPITIKSDATSANLTFWLNVSSDETTTATKYDNLYVDVRDTAGNLLSTVGTFSNLNKAAAGTYAQKSFSLLAYKGQTVKVQFRATTDSSAITTFRIDDVSVK